MRDHVVRAAVEGFKRQREELKPILEATGGALHVLVRQRHHGTGEDQGWAFDEVEVEQAAGGLIFYGELFEGRPTPGAPGRSVQKRVRIYMDPESLDSIELEHFSGKPA